MLVNLVVLLWQLYMFVFFEGLQKNQINDIT